MGFTSAGSGRYVASGHPDPRLGAVVFAIVVALCNRIRRPTMMIWVVLGLLAAGRFIEFFARSDSATTLLGLETAQWTSLLLIALPLPAQSSPAG
jgi:disulfide bond formation protein DsbB